MPTGCNSIIVGGISDGAGGWGCKEGFELGTDQCIDIDECAQGVNGTDACDSSAECLNIVGTYKCTCISGYIGNGKTECKLKPKLRYHFGIRHNQKIRLWKGQHSDFRVVAHKMCRLDD